MKSMKMVKTSSKNNYEISWIKILRSILLKHRFALIVAEIRRRLYSDSLSYVLRRDLTLPVPEPKIDIPLILRPIHPEDIPKLLNLDAPGLPNEEVLERIRCLRLLKSGLRTCYVVVTHDNTPCNLSWLIDSNENQQIQTFFKGGILPLAQDEVLTEAIYTPEEYRRWGIRHWRRAKLFEQCLKFGKKWAVAYVRDSNIASLKSNKSIGYVPYLVRKEKRRFFGERFVFTNLPAGSSYPIDE